MIALIFSALSAAQPAGDTAAPIKYDAITLDRALELDGLAVTITFTPASPCYTWGAGKSLVTIAGPAPAASFERTVLLKGNRMRDADLGCARLTVHGRLRVIRHPESKIGGKTFAGYTEVRLEELGP